MKIVQHMSGQPVKYSPDMPMPDTADFVEFNDADVVLMVVRYPLNKWVRRKDGKPITAIPHYAMHDAEQLERLGFEVSDRRSEPHELVNFYGPVACIKISDDVTLDG